MSFADHRAQFLRTRVLTASPAQRVVMLYDRLALDLAQARNAEDPYAAGQHIGHAMEIVGELQASLDLTAGAVADNLSRLYGYAVNELVAARCGDLSRLDDVEKVITPLRAAWAEAADIVATDTGGTTVALSPRIAAATGAWIG